MNEWAIAFKTLQCVSELYKILVYAELYYIHWNNTIIYSNNYIWCIYSCMTYLKLFHILLFPIRPVLYNQQLPTHFNDPAKILVN